MELKKKCSKCGEEKELNEFYNKKGCKDGVNSHCKECVKKKSILYRKENLEKVRERDKINNAKNKDYIKEYNIKYRKNNKEYLAAQQKKKYESNKSYYNNLSKQYQEDNKVEILVKHKKYIKEKRKKDPLFRLKCVLRVRLYHSLKQYDLNKDEHTIEYLGISIGEFKNFISNKFLPEMDWENYGRIWELDHIIPVSKFNLMDENQLKECFYYLNYQPLFKTTEIAKSFGYTNQIGNRNKYNNII